MGGKGGLGHKLTPGNVGTAIKHLGAAHPGKLAAFAPIKTLLHKGHGAHAAHAAHTKHVGHVGHKRG
jgi:hypothetical protein